MSGMTDERALEAVASYLSDAVYQYLSDRLRGEAQAEQKAVAVYQLRDTKRSAAWFEVDAANYADFAHPASIYEYRTLYTRPQAALSSTAAPAPVAGEAVESIAVALWHRFAPDDRIQWEEETEKAIYRDAAQQVAALAQDRASQAGAPVGVPEGWRLVPVEPTPEMLDSCALDKSWKHLRHCYAAMLAAAPSPDAEGEVRRG